MTALVILTGSLPGDPHWVMWSAAAAVAGVAGLVCFYRALATGTMGVVAAIASLGAAVPVTLGLALGEQPSALAFAGMPVALAGVALASGPELHEGVSARPLLLASVAAVGFGFALFCLDRGARVSALHTVWGMRLTSVTVMVVIALAARSIGAVRPSDAPVLVVVGFGDVGANALLAVASSRGLVSVASVLGSLYTLATLLLARFVLRERLTGLQKAGVGVALAGVVAIGVGG